MKIIFGTICYVIKIKTSNESITFTDDEIKILEDAFDTIGISDLGRGKWELYELYTVCALEKLIQKIL